MLIAISFDIIANRSNCVTTYAYAAHYREAIL